MEGIASSCEASTAMERKCEHALMGGHGSTMMTCGLGISRLWLGLGNGWTVVVGVCISVGDAASEQIVHDI